MKSQIKVNGNKVVVGPVKIGFVHVFKADASLEGSSPKFSLRVMLDKTDPNIKQTIEGLKSAIESAKSMAQEKGMFPKGFPPNAKLPLKDGDTDLNTNGEPKEPGYFIFDARASEERRPGVVDMNRMPITDQSEVYSGCYAVLDLNFFGYDMSANKGVSCGLNNVMKVADGEPLGGGKVSPEKAFAGFDVELDLDLQNDDVDLLG